MEQPTPVTLEWRDLHYSVKTRKGPKEVLRGVSGYHPAAGWAGKAFFFHKLRLLVLVFLLTTTTTTATTAVLSSRPVGGFGGTKQCLSRLVHQGS